mmetsp:Transcript_47785/g.53465  ORF Transcript_47785/g.53465 Transcript_47785/m.53465 type:complete len:314 (+) Transcript_47785:115-1056(+)
MFSGAIKEIQYSMPEFGGDEFGRVRKNNGDGGPVTSPPCNDSHPRQSNEISTGERRCENGYYYGPASQEREEDRIIRPGLVINGEVNRIESYGAFVNFRDLQQRNHKGLLHISQLANHRVESVADILEMNQQVRAVILEVEYDQRIGQRIRLSLKDVDQKTGVYSGRDLSNGSSGANNYRGGVKRSRATVSPHQLQIRARLRRETLLTLRRHWSDVEHSSSLLSKGGKMNDKDPSYLRKLWSSSPSPLNKQDSKLPLKKESRRKYDAEEKKLSTINSSSDDDSDDSSTASSSSSSSDSYDTDRRRRRRRRRRK